MTSDIDKIKQRRERFGNENQASEIGKSNSNRNNDFELKNKRKERFGGKSQLSISKEFNKEELNDDTIKKRKEKFGEVEKEDKALIGKDRRHVRLGLRKGRKGFSFIKSRNDSRKDRKGNRNGFKRRLDNGGEGRRRQNDKSNLRRGIGRERRGYNEGRRGYERRGGNGYNRRRY